jgi:aminoglycoside phosphotransferase (APT) family kinase protein
MPDLSLDRGFLETYLMHRLDGARSVTIDELTKYPRGVSRETWFVTCAVEDSGGQAVQRSLVFRRDLAGGSVCPATLRFEFEIYRRLGPSPVPVAPVLWFEDDPQWLADGREFYVREHVDGEWDIPDVTNPRPEFDDLRIAVSKEHLRKLALVHTCDWEELGFGDIMIVPPGVDACATTAIDRLVAELESFQLDPFPVVEEAVGWLRSNTPSDAPRISLLKGTNGLGEEVFRDGEIVAMSDWELASLGDPASDFAHVQDFLPDIVREGRVLWGLEPALEYYEEVSGLHVTKASIEYYRTVGALEMVVFAHNSAVPLAQGTDHLARLAWVSTEVLYWAKNLLAGAAGVFAA